MYKRQALALFQQPDSLDALRYLAAPPISEDDLKILVDSASLAPRTFTADPALAARLVQTIQAVIDPRRFPWHAERREATREERQAAVMASTVLIAAQRLATRRRSEGKQVQETLVRQTLLDHGLEIVAIPGNAIQTLSQAPVSYTHLDVYKRQVLRQTQWQQCLPVLTWPSTGLSTVPR